MKWFALFGLVALIGCSKQSESPRVEINWRGAVIGKDDRVKDTTWGEKSPVGRLWTHFDNNTIGNCVATLVSKYLIITARHCLFYEKELKYTKIEFTPDSEGNSSQATIYKAELVEDGGEEHLSGDWAILKLDHPLGIEISPVITESLTIDDLTSKEFSSRLKVVSYLDSHENIKTRVSHTGCSAMHFLSISFNHDCDTHGPGTSGSPVFIQDSENKEWHLVGINTLGPVIQGGPNAGIPSSFFSQKLMNLILKESSAEPTKFTACNDTTEELFVATAYYFGGWRSRAWTAVPAKECAEVTVSLARISGPIWLYAENKDLLAFKSDDQTQKSFCTQGGKLLSRADRDSCNWGGPKMRRLEYSYKFELDPSRKNTYRFQ